MADRNAGAEALFGEFARALGEGRSADADALLRQLRAAHRDDPLARYASGLASLARGDAAGARIDLEAAAAARPRDAAVQSNHALCLQELGLHDAAIHGFDQALALTRSHADAHYNRAISFDALGRLDDAIAGWRRAVELQPAHAQAWTRMANALHRRGRIGEALAACERAATLRPRHAATIAQRALLRLAHNDDARALDDATSAVALDPGEFAGCYAQAAALHRLQRDDEACAAADRALALRPDDAATLKLRGLAHQARHRLDAAARDVTAAARRRFAAGGAGDEASPELRAVTRAKLRHDVEQFQYLAERGLLSDSGSLIDSHRRLLESLPASVGDTAVVELDAAQLAELHGGYNRWHHVADAPRIAQGALDPALDRGAIERDYAQRSPGITWIDGLLRSEAIAALRRYCLESTFWFDYRHANGYLGAFFEDGFAAPLLLQIAEELRVIAPSIFRDYPLLQLWAFKYDARLDGIELHADIAKVNVNFWITPDDANLEPAHGGLLVWDRRAPPQWGLDEFNTSGADGQQRIRRFLDDSDAQCVRVPYRCNRAVIFDSDLFHRTDSVNFAPGYENRRINVTMLFGRRDGRLR